MKSGSTKSETTIARLRCERGLTQAALAKGTGVNIRTIQKFDSGERGIETASLAVALRIADFLGVHPRDLIGQHSKAPTLATRQRRGLFFFTGGRNMKKRRFKHLSWNDRLRIESFLKCGKRVQEIADEIGVHRNTIYNELKRGRYIHRNSDWTEEER